MNKFNYYYIFRLKSIDLFESCSIQIGDTHWYTIKDTDNMMTMKQWRAKCTEAFNAKPGSLSSISQKDQLYNQPLDIKQIKNTVSNELKNLNDLLCKYKFIVL